MVKRSRPKAGSIAGALLSVMLSATAAFAQAPPSPTNPQQPSAAQPSRPGCAPAQQQRAAGSDQATTGTAPLSDKLAKSNGVICPPTAGDSEMVAPAPNVGKMPVIPPPGSPGGDPNVQPK